MRITWAEGNGTILYYIGGSAGNRPQTSDTSENKLPRNGLRHILTHSSSYKGASRRRPAKLYSCSRPSSQRIRVTTLLQGTRKEGKKVPHRTVTPPIQEAPSTRRTTTQMTPPPCLCKVDCGTSQGFSPFLLLSAAAALIIFVLATAVAPKQRRVLQASQAQLPREATSHSSSSDSSREEKSTDSDSDSDSDGDNPNLPDSASRAISPARLRADVEIRLGAFRRDQDATL